jgi:hypothetical protein
MENVLEESETGLPASAVDRELISDKTFGVLLHVPPGLRLKICVLFTEGIYVFYGTKNRELLFIYTTLAYWFLLLNGCVYWAV